MTASVLVAIPVGTAQATGTAVQSTTIGVACVDNAYRVAWEQAGVYVERSQSSRRLKVKSVDDRVTGPSGWHRYWDHVDGHYWTKVWVSDPNYYVAWMRSGALDYVGCA